MKRPKQLLVLNKRILLAHVIKIVLESPLDPIIVVLGSQAKAVNKALQGALGLDQGEYNKIQIVYNPQYNTGQASSVKAGLEALPDSAGSALFVMGDQAGLKNSVIDAVLARACNEPGQVVVRPFYGGAPDGPVYWDGKFFRLLMDLEGDEGGRAIFRRLGSKELVRLDLAREDRPVDLDSPEDYERWRRAAVESGDV